MEIISVPSLYFQGGNFMKAGAYISSGSVFDKPNTQSLAESYEIKKFPGTTGC